ncbi:hypothetical protein IWQ60_000612 [Tieghemiomyces parasiticus]|uniref:Histone chaperone RTT106/FACT complex subunit SPT16-like middle domain-containing protein n=1 Tax=Tieghemiomyces parasiticus TaxID=78921 RepID=A0A9W8AG61_9FUNG|nr:hypothetical protein IWQ60_000612 [Tieghemiomyces parasiticus]
MADPASVTHRAALEAAGAIADATLRQDVEQCLKTPSGHKSLVARILQYYANRTKHPAPSTSLAPAAGLKRSRPSDARDVTPLPDRLDDCLCRIRDLGFTQPRKKLDCCFSATHLLLATEKDGAGRPQFEGVYALSDVVRVLAVPTPEKTKPHVTVIIWIRPEGASEDVSLAFGCFQDTPALAITGPVAANLDDMVTNTQRVLWVLRHCLSHIPLIIPQQLAQDGVMAKTPTGDARPVRAYLKARDGHLYFLDQGILFGFRKPLLFFPRVEIRDLEVRGVTSRTFNLHLRWEQPPTSDPKRVRADAAPSEVPARSETVEFDMIDYAEFDRIMDYIRSQKIAAESLLGQIENSSRGPAANQDGKAVPDEGQGGDGNPATASTGGQSQNILNLRAGDDEEEDDDDFNPEARSGSEECSDGSDDEGSQSDTESGSEAGEEMDGGGDVGSTGESLEVITVKDPQQGEESDEEHGVGGESQEESSGDDGEKEEADETGEGEEEEVDLGSDDSDEEA